MILSARALPHLFVLHGNVRANRIGVRIAVLCACLAWSHQAFSSSSRPTTSSVYREHTGRSLSKPVPNDQPEFGAEPSRSEKVLIRRLSEAGKRGHWMDVKKLFSNYSGYSAPVYNAATQAAYPCGKYKEGGKIFQSLRMQEALLRLSLCTSESRLLASCECVKRSTKSGRKSRRRAG